MRARAAWLLILALLVVLNLPAAAMAAPDTPDRDHGQEQPIDLKKLRTERKLRLKLYTVGDRIARYMTAALEAADEGNPEEGLKLLKRLNPVRLNPHERAVLYRMMGYVSYGAGDYDSAIEHFEQALAEEILPIKEEAEIRFSIAQLNAALMHWSKTISALHEWFRYVEDPKPVAYYLLAIAHYQLEEIDTAIANAEKAVDLSPDAKENWLQLLAALYVQKQDYAKAVPVLEELVVRFPKKQYWVQLSLIYGAREDYRSSLAVQQVAYLQGFLTEDKELRRLARGYLYHNLPYRAAQVLKKGLDEGKIEADADAFELLANSWLAAREYDRSLGPLQRAAELSQDGKLYVRLGQVHMQREEWNHSTEMLRKALDKGDLKDVGTAHLLLGICYYNDHKVGKALASFGQARKHASTRKQADDWIHHIEKETKQAETSTAWAAPAPDEEKPGEQTRGSTLQQALSQR